MTGWRRCDVDEYTTAIREDEILPFATTRMDLENIMVSEMSDKKLRTTWLNLYMGYKSESNNEQTRKTNKHS